MLKITITKDSWNNFGVVKFANAPVDYLAEFLATDGINSVKKKDYKNDFYISWLSNPNSKVERISGNLMKWWRKDGKVYLDSQLPAIIDDCPEPYAESAEVFINVIEQWYGILQQRPLPEEVILMAEGSKITLIPMPNAQRGQTEQMLPAVLLSERAVTDFSGKIP